MTAPLVTYRHPAAGFTLPLPGGWDTVEDTEGVALIALEPARGPWFRANVVVTVEQLAQPPDLAGWQDRALGVLRQALTELVLIDLEDTDVGGHPARRTVAHHRTETEQSIDAVAMEQWALVAGPLGYTLTASVAALEYRDFAETFARIAGGFRPDPEFRP